MAPEPPPPFVLREISEGIHAAVAVPGGFGLCNAGIVDLCDATLVFDSMLTPMAGEELRRAAERLTGRPVDYVVNSHYHGDHVRGNMAFAPVRIVSSRKTRSVMAERSLAHLAEDRSSAAHDLEELRSGRMAALPSERVVYEGWFQGILETPGSLRIVLPDLTFDHELVIHGSRRDVHLRTYGGGHSPSDVFAVVPDQKVAFLGDLLSIGFHPWLTDGDPEKFSEILDRIGTLGPERTLPGHGPVGTGEDIRRMGEYVAEVRREGREARRRGATLEEVGRTPTPERYAAWNFSSQYAENVAFVFGRTDASGGTGAPVPP
jgi:glyoxylase-like metal-dependent hydrolase (beta-lactamase superfamily II)